MSARQSQPERDQPVRTPSAAYSMLPGVLQIGLQPLALVRKTVSDYSLRSRKRVTSLAIFRSESEDTLMAGEELVVATSDSADCAEVSGICWKFAHHGRILHTETIHQNVANSFRLPYPPDFTWRVRML